MKKKIYAILLSGLIAAAGIQAAAKDGPDLKNFMLMPESRMETFEEEMTLKEGVLEAEFLTLTEGSSSYLETEEDGNAVLVVVDTEAGVDERGIPFDNSPVTLTIKPVEDVAFGKCILSFDFCVPGISTANAGDSNGEYLRLSVVGRDKTTNKECSPANFNFMIQSREEEKSQFVFQLVDGEISTYTWFGGGKHNFDQWYTLRYEMNMETQLYNIYLYDRRSGNLVTKEIGRALKTTSTTANTSSSDYLLEGFRFQVNAARNGEPMQVKFDNIAIAREQFLCPGDITIQQETDRVTASVVVNNQTLRELPSPVLMLAIYDSQGRLMDMAFDQKAAFGKEEGTDGKLKDTVLSCTLKKPKLGTGYTTKAAVISSFLDAKQYTAVCEPIG